MKTSNIFSTSATSPRASDRPHMPLSGLRHAAVCALSSNERFRLRREHLAAAPAAVHQVPDAHAQRGSRRGRSAQPVGTAPHTSPGRRGARSASEPCPSTTGGRPRPRRREPRAARRYASRTRPSGRSAARASPRCAGVCDECQEPLTERGQQWIPAAAPVTVPLRLTASRLARLRRCRPRSRNTDLPAQTARTPDDPQSR